MYPDHEHSNRNLSLEPIKLVRFGGMDPERFIDFLKEVPVEFILEDRHAQAALANIMDNNFTRDEAWKNRVSRPDRIMLITPPPSDYYSKRERWR